MKQLNAALCSFGMSGRVFHAPFIHLHPQLNLYAVWERSTQQAAAIYPAVKSCSSFDQLLNDPAIDIIVVNTPNYTHHDFALAALKAGKHVVVEKPFCNTVEECHQLIEAAAANNCKLAVYQNRRWDSDFLAVKNVVDKNLLGEIVEAEFHFDRFDENLSYKLHKETPGPGAGILYDLGPHLIDQALFLFGMPNEIFADIGCMRPQSKVDDYFELLLLYNTLRVRLKAGYIVLEPVPSFVLHGRKGSFLKPRSDRQEELLKQGIVTGVDTPIEEAASTRGLLHTADNCTIVKIYLDTITGNYFSYYDQLYKAIAFNEQLPVTAEEGRNVIAIIEKAFQSSRDKKIISVK